MEVLASYPHCQLGSGLTSDITSRCPFGVSSIQGYESQTPSSTVATRTQEDPLNFGMKSGGMCNSDTGTKASQDKEEKDSDTGVVAVSTNSRSSPKDKERSQMAYLMSSLPALGNLFELHRKIGEGTFSSVFLATLKDATPGSSWAKQQFAVKHLIPTTHPTRAERELRCLLDIGGHDNVVGVHLCLRNQDSIAFVMPYLSHRRFSEYVVDMGVKETRTYMKNLLLALRRVHSFNIIHRDVKPSNFLYDRETKQFLLVDFGLSQPVEETSRIQPVPVVPPSNSRKRKRDKETPEVGKGLSCADLTENVAKRQALAPRNSMNIIKSPEKIHKMTSDFDIENKAVPLMASNRAKILQNIKNMNAPCLSGSKSATTSIGMKRLKMSPSKDVIENSHGRKTPRKNKHNINNENMISPFKYDNQSASKRPCTFGGNEIWKDDSMNQEKFALDLRTTVKTDTDTKRSGTLFQPGARSSLQRKIIFDDVPDEKTKLEDLKFRSRCSPMTPRQQMAGKQAVDYSQGPHGTPLPVSGMYKNSPSTSSASFDPMILGSPVLSPTDSGNTGKEFRTLVPDRSKEVFPGSSIVRVQNSQVKSQQLSPVTPGETRRLKSQPIPHESEKSKDHQKVVFAKPQAPSSNGGVHRGSVPSSPQCSCHGKPQVCSICLSKKPHNAPRAGTPGFRPPEVLLRSQLQTTAVDMWAVGVMLLCILSGCYPFFRSPDDLTALAEIMTVFGTDKIKETAARLGRMVVCSQPSQALDLKKLCTRMRQRRKDKTSNTQIPTDIAQEKCVNCCQRLGIPDGCLCQKDQTDPLHVNSHCVNNVEESDDVFPDSAYHLLGRLLDLNADTRITAAEALEHPFVLM